MSVATNDSETVNKLSAPVHPTSRRAAMVQPDWYSEQYTGRCADLRR